MHRPAKRLLLLCTVVFAFLPLIPQTTFAAIHMKKGDRIIFFGDSITKLGTDDRHGFVSLIKDKLKDKGVEVIGSGVGGNTTADLERRIKPDVLEAHPNIVVLFIGINDVWSRKVPLPVSKANLTDLVEKLKGSGAQVVLCTQTIIGEQRHNELDDNLEKLVATTREIASHEGVTLCDLHVAFKHYLQTHNPHDLRNGVLTIDGVHLTDEGNRIVAQEIARALGI